MYSESLFIRILSFVALGLMIMAIFIGVATVIISLEKIGCSRLSEATNIETKYVVLGGDCLVKVNDRYIPRDNWKGEFQQ